jgi:hypothetical protein
MKKWLLAASLVCLSSVARAEAGVFIGLSMQLGGKFSSQDLGLSAKVVSSNREDRAVLGGGISFYPFGPGSTRVGLDVGAGVQGRSAGALIGYDLLLGRPTRATSTPRTSDPIGSPGTSPLPPSRDQPRCAWPVRSNPFLPSHYSF